MGVPTARRKPFHASRMPVRAESNALIIRSFNLSTGVITRSRSRPAAPPAQDTKVFHQPRAVENTPVHAEVHQERNAFIPLVREVRSDVITPLPQEARRAPNPVTASMARPGRDANHPTRLEMPEAIACPAVDIMPEKASQAHFINSQAMEPSTTRIAASNP